MMSALYTAAVTSMPVIGLRLLDGRVGSTLLPPDRGGPIPFEPSLVTIERLAPAMLKGMWEAVSGELRRSEPSARYYAEKLVGNSQLLYASGIPLRLIDVVRDPRDVFCSIRAFNSGDAGFGRSIDHSDEDFLERLVVEHRHRLREMVETPRDVPRISVRYEDLVMDLTAHADMLGNWLGLELDADQALAEKEPDHPHMTSVSAAESVGRWRRELSPDLAARAWSVLGDMLGPLGYTAE